MVTRKEKIASISCFAFSILLLVEVILESNPNYERLRSLGSFFLFFSLAFCPSYFFTDLKHGLTQEFKTIFISQRTHQRLMLVGLLFIFVGYVWQFVL